MPSAPSPLRRLLAAPRVRDALIYGGPTLGIVILVMLPVILGHETLILRDVHQTHLMLKASQADALRQGALPIVDVHRGGGQPLTGNPNAVPFYPDNLLYALAPILWALNAHFWLHWLIAPAGLYLLARAWGVGRSGAWAAGVCWATSGFFLSQLNLYNLVAGVALVPFLVAAVLRATEEEAPRRGIWAAFAGLLWALVLLSGDPSSPLAGALLAAGAVAVRSPRSFLDRRAMGPLALAIALGTLVALPQIVELLRVLPATDRGHRGVGEWRMSVAAWRPAHAVEWLVPTAFGRYDLWGEGGFWAQRLFAGSLPFLLSLYPGVLGASLVLASGLPRRRRAIWAWGMVALGVLLSAGGTTPVGQYLLELPGARLFRYPVKLWLLVAVGASLLCGIGFERTFGRSSPRPARLAWALTLLAALLGTVLVLLVADPGRFHSLVLSLAPEHWSQGLAEAEWARWIATLVIVLVLVAALALCLVLSRRRPVLAASLLLALHTAGQVHLLRGLLITDETDRLARPSPLLEHLDRGERVAHGYLGLFGEEKAFVGPDNRVAWALRQDFDSLIPGAGIVQADLRYELNRSPEGLSSFLLRAAHDAIAVTRSDRERLLALSRWGVEHVIVDEPLAGVPAALADASVVRGVVDPIHLYRLRRPAPDVLLADLPVRVPHLNAAWSLFVSPGFDPERHVVLPPADGAGAGDAVPPLPSTAGPEPGRLRVLRSGDELLETEVETPVPAVLVLQRAVLPVWRATVDGEPVEIEPANLYRIGVPVPAGSHRVRLWVERGPLRLALAGSALGALGLLALGLTGRAGRRREAVEVEGVAEDVDRPVPEQPVGRRPLGAGGVEPADEVLGGDDVVPRPR